GASARAEGAMPTYEHLYRSCAAPNLENAQSRKPQEAGQARPALAPRSLLPGRGPDQVGVAALPRDDRRGNPVAKLQARRRAGTCRKTTWFRKLAGAQERICS